MFAEFPIRQISDGWGHDLSCPMILWFDKSNPYTDDKSNDVIVFRRSPHLYPPPRWGRKKKVVSLR